MALVYNSELGIFVDTPAPPIIHRFEFIQSSSFYQGDSGLLQWDVENADHIYINDEEQNSNNKLIQFESSGQISLKLIAKNADGTAERTVSIDVLKRPAFIVHSSALVLHEGLNEKITFNWKIENSIKLILHYDGTIEELPLEGSISLVPSEDTQYDFEASGIDGCRVFHHIIPVKIRKAAKIDFKANRIFSYPNLPIRLSWDVENAESVYIDGVGERPTNGSLTVTPGIDTTYILRVKDAFGEEQRTLTVKMLPLPVITQILVPNPKIEENLAISYKTPQFEAIVPVPTFESSLVKLTAPKIPSLRLSSHFVHPIAKKDKRGFRKPFKTLYSYFFGK